MSDGDSDKQFDPTPKKLEDARKKGEIARSADLTTAAGYGGFVIAAFAFGGASLLHFADVLTMFIAHADQLATTTFATAPMPLLGGTIAAVSGALFPWFALPGLFALICVVAQRAFLFSPSKLAPKLSRISPISGAKNKFGRQGLFEFAKSATKLTIYCVILGLFLSAQIDRMIAAITLNPAMIMVELSRLMVQLFLIVLCVAITLGGIDFLWQSAEHTRKNRMSRQEVMDETKQSEGDPMMKHQRRQKGYEIAMSKMLKDVPTADVIVVNPTHYAVALKWDPAGQAAPTCVAKGVDEIAARIRELAIAHDVPIHSDPPTARALFSVIDVGQEIQPKHYAAVAVAIRFAETMRQKARKT